MRGRICAHLWFFLTFFIKSSKYDFFHSVENESQFFAFLRLANSRIQLCGIFLCRPQKNSSRIFGKSKHQTQLKTKKFHQSIHFHQWIHLRNWVDYILPMMKTQKFLDCKSGDGHNLLIGEMKGLNLQDCCKAKGQ